MASIIVPERTETRSVKRGRDVLRRIWETVDEMDREGRKPAQVEISTGLCDDLRAFFAHCYVFDGVLPDTVYDVPIVYTPGASRRVRFMGEAQ